VPVEKKIGWAKSARNYFISKAQELERVLVWAAKFQTTTITTRHVEALGQGGL
jgi:hypothetical protein